MIIKIELFYLQTLRNQNSGHMYKFGTRFGGPLTDKFWYKFWYKFGGQFGYKFWYKFWFSIWWPPLVQIWYKFCTGQVFNEFAGPLTAIGANLERLLSLLDNLQCFVRIRGHMTLRCTV